MISFQFTVPGQPISWDAAYRTGRMPVKRGGRPVLNEDMTQRYIRRPILTDEASVYRGTVAMFARLAKPSRWVPSGLLRVVLDLRLSHDIDADNVLKLILDGVAEGLGYNDRNFLPCVQSKTVDRRPNDACVIVTVEGPVAEG